MNDITTRARELLAAATPGPWEADAWCSYDDGGWAAIGPHHMATEDEGYDDAPGSPAYDRAMADSALIAAAPELIAALCDELESADRRNMNQVGLIDAWAGKCERVEAERDALRADVERLRAELASVMGECARLRSDVDVEREQSAVFVKEIERLRVVEAGAAIMRRVLNDVGRYAEWASTVREALRDGAGNDFLFRLLSAESDLAHTQKELAFDRKYAEQALDAASAEKERLRAEIEKERADVERLRARKAEMCGCVHATGMIGESFVDVDDDCPNCGGTGGIIEEGQK